MDYFDTSKVSKRQLKLTAFLRLERQLKLTAELDKANQVEELEPSSSSSFTGKLWDDVDVDPTWEKLLEDSKELL